MSLHTEIGLPFRVNLAALPETPSLARRFLTKLLGLWGIEGETAPPWPLPVAEATARLAPTSQHPRSSSEPA